ncbi:MAG: hypothetical protein FWC89_09075 [Defluviitaleaceae bacterium]|nr:hypothetical protein [Defluviitaleaceae bacterium]
MEFKNRVGDDGRSHQSPHTSRYVTKITPLRYYRNETSNPPLRVTAKT